MRVVERERSEERTQLSAQNPLKPKFKNELEATELTLRKIK